MNSSYQAENEVAPGAAHLGASSGRLSRMTLCRVAFVLMCFAPQMRYLWPQVGLAALLVGVMFAFVSLPWHRLTKSSIFFGAYFVAFGTAGLALQLLGEVPPGMPPARPLFFYALTTLALVLAGITIVRHGGSRFVLKVLCALLIVEIVIVGLQFSLMSYGFGLEPREYTTGQHLIEGSYGNPNNVAVVLAMLLMVLVMSGYVRMSSMFGAMLVVATLAATFVTLSRTALACLVVFLVAALLAPSQRRLSIARCMRTFGRALPVLMLMGAGLIMLLRSGVVTNLEDLAVIDRSLTRVATLSSLGQDSSVEFRMVVGTRLFEALDSLGFGTLSDKNYDEFFRPGDPALAMVNPHSYLVEMSFLFGYLGLFMALAFLAGAVWRIIVVKGGRRLLVVLFGIAVLFFQMVPSSVFSVDIFFLLAVIAGTSGLHSPRQPSSRSRSAPSAVASQVLQP